MFIERVPTPVRALYPRGRFRMDPQERKVYLTFDDGPIPEATPEILDILAREDVKATFFMVGDNVRKYPEIARRVIDGGHAVGNHTFHHIKALGMGTASYRRDVVQASGLIPSRLFRPPHGWLWSRQWRVLRRDGFRLVYYDLVTRDYSRRMDARGVVENVRRYARPGSIIVFHDSLKSIGKLRTALPESIRWLKEEGYSFGLLTADNV